MNRNLLRRWGAFALFCVLLIGVTAWNIQRDYEETLEAEFRALEHKAQIATAQVGGLLRGLDVGLQNLVADQQAQPPIPASISGQRLRAFLKMFPEVKTVLVTDANGSVTQAETTFSEDFRLRVLRFNAAERDYFKVHQQAEAADFGQCHVSRPFVSLDKQQTFAISRSIRKPNGEFLGVVTASLDPAVFLPVLKEMLTEDIADATAIHNRAGDILFRLPDPEKHIGKNIAAGPAFQHYLQSPTAITRYLGMVATDQQKRILVFGRIGKSGLDVGLSGRYERVMTEWQRQSLWHVLGSLLVVVLGLALNLSRLRRREAAAV
jgi:hypothetical protein